MNEEKLTKTLLKEILKGDNDIICFDFPQSGTGVVFHSSKKIGKALDSFVPDILLKIKSTDKYVIFENKAYFSLADIKKLKSISCENLYLESIENYLQKKNIQLFYALAYHSNQPHKELEKYKTQRDYAFLSVIVRVDSNLKFFIEKNSDNLKIFT